MPVWDSAGAKFGDLWLRRPGDVAKLSHLWVADSAVDDPTLLFSGMAGRGILTNTARDSAFVAAETEAITSRLRTNTAGDAAFVAAEIQALTRHLRTNTALDSAFVLAEIEAITSHLRTNAARDQVFITAEIRGR